MLGLHSQFGSRARRRSRIINKWDRMDPNNK